MNFYETYECKIDEKGRLKLPSTLVKLLEATENKNFVVKRSVARTCLEIYPMAPWQKIMAKISRKNHKAGFPYLNIKEGFLALKNNQTIEKKLRKISLVD